MDHPEEEKDKSVAEEDTSARHVCGRRRYMAVGLNGLFRNGVGGIGYPFGR